MDILEVDQKDRLSRAEVAARLHNLPTCSPATTTSSSSVAGWDSRRTCLTRSSSRSNSKWKATSANWTSS